MGVKCLTVVVGDCIPIQLNDNRLVLNLLQERNLGIQKEVLDGVGVWPVRSTSNSNPTRTEGRNNQVPRKRTSESVIRRSYKNGFHKY